MMNTVLIDYYSDILCIWAYIGHARISELQKQFNSQLKWHWHYLPVFGDVPNKLQNQWQDRGGAAGYAAHVREVVAKFDHVQVNDQCWETVQPVSSAPAHLWLAAARLLEKQGRFNSGAEESLAWAIRVAFFEHAINIAKQDALIEIAQNIGLDTQAMLDCINDGMAYAVLCEDMLLARDANIRISPSYVFNQDRQRLTGNVGYRIIEANVKELIEQPQKQQSWC